MNMPEPRSARLIVAEIPARPAALIRVNEYPRNSAIPITRTSAPILLRMLPASKPSHSSFPANCRKRPNQAGADGDDGNGDDLAEPMRGCSVRGTSATVAGAGTLGDASI